MNTTPEFQSTCDRLVRNEVYLCVSSLVSTLAQGGGAYVPEPKQGTYNLAELCDQALELAAPLSDYEEAAIQAGWVFSGTNSEMQRTLRVNEFDTTSESEALTLKWAENPEMACQVDDLELYEREVFEHWAVSEWLADKLIAKGERVDKDFAGLCVWARTTTGQAISIDSVIEQICRETYAK